MLDYAVIGKRIQSLRQKKHFTQEYIAEKAGISIPHLSRIENGSGKPSLQTLVNICNALAVTLDEIMQDNINAETTNGNALEVACTPDEISMLTDILHTIRLQYNKRDT